MLDLVVVLCFDLGNLDEASRIEFRLEHPFASRFWQSARARLNTFQSESSEALRHTLPSCCPSTLQEDRKGQDAHLIEIDESVANSDWIQQLLLIDPISAL